MAGAVNAAAAPPAAPRASKARRVTVLVAMSLLYFLLMAGTFNALGVALPAMVAELGMSWAQAGFGFTLLGIACGIASLVPAALIRHIGISLTLIVGAVTLAGGYACLAGTHSTLVYHIGTTLLGLGYCICGTVPGTFIIAGLFARRSTALGIYFATGGLGSVVGPLIFFGVNSRLDDWRGFWAICAVVALIAGGFAAIVTRGRDAGAAAGTPVDAAADGGWTARAAIRTPQFWVIVAAYTVCLLVNTTVHSFSVQHLVERGLSLGAAATVMSAAALIGVGASSAAGVIGEKTSPRMLTLVALATLAAATGVLALPQGWGTLVAFVIAFGGGLGLSYLSTAMLLIDFFGRRPNLELYSLMCMVSTSAAIGPALGGMQRDHSGSFVGVFATLAGLCVLLFVGVLATRKRAAPVADAAADLAANYA